MEHIHERSAAYGIPGNVYSMVTTSADVCEGFKSCRTRPPGKGPVLIESAHLSLAGHSSSDPGKYRTFVKKPKSGRRKI